MSDFYVFDLDGTLADCTHRLHYLDRKDWRAFFAACGDDVPIEHTLGILRALRVCRQRVEIWSGRSDEVRAETEEWLDRQAVNPEILTRMRVAGDHRPDKVVKREFLIDCGDERPTLIFEDRKRVVDMWRGEGISCFHVASGEF